MKLLVQVSTIDGERQAGIIYAVIEVTDATTEYLTTGKALFTASKQFADHLATMRFWGCSFITFYNDLDLSKFIDENEKHLFDELGYWAVSDDFAKDVEEVECEFEQVVLDGDSWYVTANEKDTGVEVKTREIPYDCSKL